MKIIDDQFSKVNRLRCDNDWREIENMTMESFFALAISGEAGELANIIKKVERGDFTYAEAKKDIEKEIADTFTYLDLLCSQMGIDFSEAIQDKFNEVSDKMGSGLKII